MLDKLARKRVVNMLNAKSQRIYATSIERVHFDKNLGIAEISKAAAEDFVRRNYPNQHEQFVSEVAVDSYPAYLYFENILSGSRRWSHTKICSRLLPPRWSIAL